MDENEIGRLQYHIDHLEHIIAVLKDEASRTNVLRAELLQRIHDLEAAQWETEAEYRKRMLEQGWQPPLTVTARVTRDLHDESNSTLLARQEFEDVSLKDGDTFSQTTKLSF